MVPQRARRREGPRRDLLLFALGGEHAAGGRARRDPRSAAGPSSGRWRGDTVVCVASGPSLTPADVEACRGRARVIAINDNFRLAPWADVLYACDLPWWDRYHEATEAVEGERWTQDERAAARYGLHLIKSTAGHGLSRIPGIIHQGSNSGYQAVGLAADFGAKRIVLLGYDMQRTDDKDHWHGPHPVGLNPPRHFQTWIINFNRLAKDAAELGIEIVNCSRATALTCFPRKELADALA